MSSKPKKPVSYREKRLESLIDAQDELMKDLQAIHRAINRIINEVLKESKGGKK